MIGCRLFCAIDREYSTLKKKDTEREMRTRPRQRKMSISLAKKKLNADFLSVALYLVA